MSHRPPGGYFNPLPRLDKGGRMVRKATASSYSPTAEQVQEYLKTVTDIWVPTNYQRSVAKPLDIFAPKTFDDYIGQAEAKELAQIMVEAAKRENRRLPNILIVGEYGLGKTALAKLIIGGVGEPERLIDGATVNKEMPTEGTVIIDEIHNLDAEVADTLNLVLDSGNLSIIGCTTDPGKLSSAFRSRFRQLMLEIYDDESLTTMLQKVCKRKGVIAASGALYEIAARSRNNARMAINNLAFIFDLMVVKRQHTVTQMLVFDAFEKLGVDEDGFLKRDYKFMRALPTDRAVGLQYLEAITGIDGKTIEEEVEPYLMRKGLLDRTSRGRLKLRELE